MIDQAIKQELSKRAFCELNTIVSENLPKCCKPRQNMVQESKRNCICLLAGQRHCHQVLTESLNADHDVLGAALAVWKWPSKIDMPSEALTADGNGLQLLLIAAEAGSNTASVLTLPDALGCI
jgi:hypothetical protein